MRFFCMNFVWRMVSGTFSLLFLATPLYSNSYCSHAASCRLHPSNSSYFCGDNSYPTNHGPRYITRFPHTSSNPLKPIVPIFSTLPSYRIALFFLDPDIALLIPYPVHKKVPPPPICASSGLALYRLFKLTKKFPLVNCFFFEEQNKFSASTLLLDSPAQDPLFSAPKTSSSAVCSCSFRFHYLSRNPFERLLPKPLVCLFVDIPRFWSSLVLLCQPAFFSRPTCSPALFQLARQIFSCV